MSETDWSIVWNGNSGQESNNFTPVQETIGSDLYAICSKISFALKPSCSNLVYPDNSLTPEGQHVKACIRNAEALASADLFASYPPTTKLSMVLDTRLAECGDVIKFHAINLKQLMDLAS